MLETLGIIFAALFFIAGSIVIIALSCTFIRDTLVYGDEWWVAATGVAFFCVALCFITLGIALIARQT